MGDTITFAELVTELNSEIWPDGSPENLLSSIRQYYVDALIDLQRWVECQQDKHTDVFPQSATFFRCGLSVIDAPRGRIHKVWTAKAEDYCDPVTYHPRNINDLKCWSRRFMDLVSAPANENMPPLPLGWRYAESSTDSKWGRALRGLYALDRGRLYVAPWIQSDEVIVVEWDGFKRKWADTDLVPDEDDFKRAVRLFVQREHAKDFERDTQSMMVFERDYREQRSELMWECQEERRLRQDVVCEAETDAISAGQSDDDTTADGGPEEATTLFAVIGDYGTPGTPANDVAALVKGWGPEFIVTTGDNNYPDGAAETIDAAVGRNYRSFIYPYAGTEPLGSGESDATENKFFPALGNHDLDTVVGGLAGQPYLDYFTLPGIERYYEFVWGHCHFFVLNSGLNTAGSLVENDGNRVHQPQAEWLIDRVAKATARWKIGVVHHPPYTSRPGVGYYPGIDALRWNYRGIGLDVLLSGHGHSYERLEIGGFPYIVNGAGGSPLVAFDSTVVTGSVVRYDADYGAIKGVATCNDLTLSFINRAGTVIDTLTLA